MNRLDRQRICLGYVLLAVLGIALLIQVLRLGEPTPAFARMTEQTLIIDPGHGGEDGGAVSISGQKESTINLAIAQQLDQIMGFYGVHTVLTRSSDVSIHDAEAETLRQKKISDIHNRVDLINSIEQGTLISIHQNSCPDADYHGAQVFFTDENRSLPLAELVQNTICSTLDRENRRVPHQAPSSIYLMHHISCRGILVECGFLSNPGEEQLLQERAYQMKLAMAMASSYLICGNTQEGESLI